MKRTWLTFHPCVSHSCVWNALSPLCSLAPVERLWLIFPKKKKKRTPSCPGLFLYCFFFFFFFIVGSMSCHVALTIATKPNRTVHITYFMYTNSSYIHCSVSVVISVSVVLRRSIPLTSPLFKETRSDSWDMLSRCSPSGLSLLCMFNNTATWPSFSVSWILGSRNLNKAFNISLKPPPFFASVYYSELEQSFWQVLSGIRPGLWMKMLLETLLIPSHSFGYQLHQSYQNRQQLLLTEPYSNCAGSTVERGWLGALIGN